MKVGGVYSVTFLDHAMHTEGESGAIKFTAYGRLVNETAKTIELRTWENSEDPSDIKNSEGFTIVKGAITLIKRLK